MPACNLCLSELTVHSVCGTKRRRGCRNCDKYVCLTCHQGMSLTCEIINIDNEKMGCAFCRKIDYIHFMYSLPTSVLHHDPDARMCSKCAEEIVVK